MRRASRPSIRSVMPYALTALASAVAFWLELIIARSAATQLSLTPTALAIAFSVWLCGLRTAIPAVALAALGIDYAVIDPGVLFRFPRAADLIVYTTFLAGWLAFCYVADRMYRRSRVEVARRTEAERAASHADRVAQLTSALSHARTPDAAIEAAVQEPLHALGADAGILLLISSDGSTADVARSVGHPTVTPGTAWALTGTKSVAAVAVGRGATTFVAEYEGESGAWEQEPLNGRRRPSAAVAVPLMIGNRVVAVAQFDFASPHAFTDEERQYLELLATRGAQAFDRTWQYEYAVRARTEAERQRARADQEISEREKIELALRASEARGRALAARTSRLHGLTAALSEAVTLHAVGKAVVHQGRTAVGAVAGEVTLLAENATAFRTLYAEGQGVEPEGTTSAADPTLCSTAAVETRQPVFVASFEEWQARFPLSASRAADGGYASSATLPLLVEGAPLGVLAFYFTVPVNFDTEYRELLVSVAQDCAQALDRARLYEAAQRARTEAEAANRLKDEFVSIVSHELRTPLNAILGWTAVLRRSEGDIVLTQRALQAVADNATRQARLIEELLDFSRIASGRVALAREEVDLRELLRGVVESVLPEAVAKNVTLDLSPVPPVQLPGDPQRLEQVFFNLLGNALKFTPVGGRVRLDVERRHGTVQVCVTDNGVGIEPDVLPFVFDRFRQGEEAARREYGGLGLGLSIARQIVEAHGGTITAESDGRDQGATFVVTLPVTTTASSNSPEKTALASS